ncbi:hypothetical protein Pmani_035153 [Petrolisthes manimaculis]|uniref:Uncharacterized protein n=1 Tax=Petrolisthes manimaculis TaxID=1843537 RepID=A0AAE1TNY7_9EUCA|nr:hypothetical protein Pmani_035153 [Petrolisthes manimaculis]
MTQANVRLIGIGLEELGVEEFIEGKFFDGELYIDKEKKSFKDLNFKRHGVLSLIPALVAKVARKAVQKAKELGVGGDMKGDGFQNGGLLVVAGKGKKVLYEYKQDNPADHAENADILKALGLEAEATVTGVDMKVTDLECEDACALPSKK